ncbi:MAG: magnesium transporter [Candidatus Omnitrophica bacterium]|nr:magnesium transporter [Candidatus Omnitrophota bacterium]
MKIPLLVPEIREYLAQNNTEELKEFCETNSPAMVADFLSALEPDEVWAVLQSVSPQLRAEIFAYLEPDVQKELVEKLPREQLARLFSDMSPDDRADLFKSLPEDKQEMILPAMAQAEREDIRRLSSYPEGTAGAVMTSDYASLPADITAAEAINRLRREAPDRETIYYAYVVDEKRRLLGFVSLKDLILAHPEEKIEKIMHQDVVSACVTDDQEEAARKIQKYDLIALPVTSPDGALLGIITHDDALDIITQEHTEDIEKLMAITGPHEAGVYLHTSAWEHFRNRVGWVVALALLGLVSGYIVQNYEGLILQFGILATFMPMLADTGGNTGSQSATLVVRALALKEVSVRDALKIVWKEFKVSLSLAVVLSVVAFGRVAFLAKNSIPAGYSWMTVGLAISTALGLQVVTSTLLGALLPLAVAGMGYDPAVVASPALTTLVDITGLFIYFATVKLFLWH